jgi:raffinose/stachyose/melibiose transport system substrate-binding protein
MALHPNVTITVESRPGGAEGDNIVKTRLASGEMTDVFWYNSGSLLQALNPSDTLVDLSSEPFIANIWVRSTSCPAMICLSNDAIV